MMKTISQEKQAQETSEISKETQSTETPKTNAGENLNTGDWELQETSLEPPQELDYNLVGGSLGNTSVLVKAIFIDKSARFAKVNTYWDELGATASANSVVFQVSENAHAFIETRSYRVMGDLFDFWILDDDTYIGFENGVVGLYIQSGYLQGVMAYTVTRLNGNIAIVTATSSDLDGTYFREDKAITNSYDFECPINSLYPAYGTDKTSFDGFYVGSACGFYHVNSNGLGDGDWWIISNDHNESGAVVLYSKDKGVVVAALYNPKDDVYYNGEIEVSKKPTAALVSGYRLALLYGNTVIIYELNDNGGYGEFGRILLPFNAKDIMIIHWPAMDIFEVGIAGDREFVHLFDKPEEFAGTRHLSISEITSETQVTTTGQTET